MSVVSELRDHRDGGGGPVVIGHDGRIVEAGAVGELSSPTLLVVPVTSALKVISADGFVEDGVDRDQTWMVAAYFLDTETVDSLDLSLVEAQGLRAAVEDLGARWDVEQADRGPGA